MKSEMPTLRRFKERRNRKKLLQLTKAPVEEHCEYGDSIVAPVALFLGHPKICGKRRNTIDGDQSSYKPIFDESSSHWMVIVAFRIDYIIYQDIYHKRK